MGSKEMEKVNLYLGDVREQIQKIPDQSLIYWDPNTTSTGLSTESFVMIEELWDEINRVAKENCRLLVQAQQPVVTEFMLKLENHYDTTWYYINPPTGGALNLGLIAKPITRVEEVMVFTLKKNGRKPMFNILEPYRLLKTQRGTDKLVQMCPENYLELEPDEFIKGKGLSTSRPVSALEYLLQTYSNPESHVLDLFMGSGSMGVAALNTQRVYSGIDVNLDQFSFAANRISSYLQSPNYRKRISKRYGKKLTV